MKNLKYSVAAVAALMLTACSSEEPANTGNDAAGDVSFASFNIVLPTSPAGRADATDLGLASEYAVTNGCVLVWQNADSEVDATFVCKADLKGMSWGSPAAGDIATSSAAVAELSNINMNDAAVQYSAAVVLNYNDEFVFPTSGQTFKAWSQTAQKDITTVTVGSTTFFTMTSAPEYTGATSEPLTLAAIDKSQIKASEASLSGTAATVTVQHVAAKVNLNTEAEYTLTSSDFNGDKVKIDAWTLDVTNKSTYPVQVVEGLMASYGDIWKTGRFYSADANAFGRLYWALDPNYSGDLTAMSDINKQFTVVATDDLTDNAAVKYCMENTFDINHQKQGQTTRVVFRGSYIPASIPNYTAGTTFFRIGSGKQLYLRADFEAAIAEAAKIALGASDATVEGLDNYAAKSCAFSLNNITIKADGAAIDNVAKNSVAQQLGLTGAADNGLKCFFRGHCFYIARVKHFGDIDTPWNMGDDTYAANNAKWLGRYGMVRNTVYDMTVKSVNSLGEPTVPELKPDAPDDEEAYFIQVNVQVLSWSKRVNEVNL